MAACSPAEVRQAAGQSRVSHAVAAAALAFGVAVAVGKGAAFAVQASHAESVWLADGLIAAASIVMAYVMARLVRMRRQATAALLDERTKLAQSERRVDHSEAQFRLLAEHASDMASRVGPDGAWLYVSPAAQRIFGIAPEALLGRGMLDCVHPEDRPAMEANMQRLLSGEVEESDVLHRAINPRRGEVWVETKGRVVRDPLTGASAGYIAVSRDVTERRRLEAERDQQRQEMKCLAESLEQARHEAERASRAKSRFLAGVSHEMRTPLNGLLGYAQILRLEGGLNAAQTSRIEAMLGAGAHLSEMINRLLDLSDIEAERIELQVSMIDLGQVALGCLDLVRPRAQEKGVALRADVARGVPVQVRADTTRLRQILLGLLENALKYTARGSIVLRLRPAANGADLRVEIVDTGSGVPAERRRGLFSGYERPGDGHVAGSAGLGLPLSARLATLLGGRLGYDDNPGGGSVFWLELPLAMGTGIAPSPIAEIAPTPGPSSVQPTAAHPLRVLVADDVAMNRDVADAFLRAAGHVVVCVEDGAGAVAAAAATDYDVILMDVRMPEMDGLEATRRIRALPGPRGRVPVVALTAQTFAEQVAECQAAGMDGHLAKPFAPEALLAAVARAAVTGRTRGGAGVRAAVPAVPAPSTELPDAELAVLDRVTR